MYMGGAAPSPAGPAEPGDALRKPPAIDLPRALQVMRFSQRQIEFVFRAAREQGETFQMKAGIPGGAPSPVTLITSARSSPPSPNMCRH